MSFQFDKWGGGFVVEVANSAPDGFTTAWGEKIGPGKVTAHDIHPRGRLRLGTRGRQDDHWFRYDKGGTVEAVAQEVVGCWDEAETWWVRGGCDKNS
jgi:hypothetical protein